ncbi:MAG: thioredoxin domain-containing protein [Candidatus Omnitrophota bacterium]
MNKLIKRIAFLILGITTLPLFCGCSGLIQAGTTEMVDSLYPGLTAGILRYAKPAELPEGIVLCSGRVEIAAKEIEDTAAKAPKELQAQLNKNLIFLLEQAATEKILLNLARESVKNESVRDDGEIIRSYLEGNIVHDVRVSEGEIKAFYEDNKEMFGGAPFDAVKGTLNAFFLQQKKQEAVTDFIKNLGQKIPISVAASWVKEQAVLARDNPVDKIRASKKPSLVDFGADGCLPCDMMTPILDNIRVKYEGKLNVLFVHVQAEQILAARYGIKSIPVQVFFDKSGKEIFRHTGFFSQEEIERKLSEMRVE